MNAEQIREALGEVLTGPFTVHLEQRTQLELLHADFATLSPTGRTLGLR